MQKLPQALFDNLTEATVEMDVRTDQTEGDAKAFTLGNEQQHLSVQILETALKASVINTSDAVEEKAEGTIEPSGGDGFTLQLFFHREV